MPRFSARGRHHLVVVRHHLGQALLIAEPYTGHFQDHGAGLGRGPPGEGRIGVARLGGIGLQPAPVLARAGIDQPSGQAAEMRGRQGQGGEQAEQGEKHAAKG